jgi:hypothetical protein
MSRPPVDNPSVDESVTFAAWGDESGAVASQDPGTYLMAAVVAAQASADELRAEARQLLLPGQRKAHWRDDGPDRHDQVTKVIAGLPLEALVVVRQGPISDRSERRRRKCFERFAVELEALGCGHLTLESRGPSDDQRDRNLLDALRSKKIATNLRLDHKRGPEDSLLWIADAVCGAVVSSRTGEPRWLVELGNLVHLVSIDDRPRA